VSAGSASPEQLRRLNPAGIAAPLGAYSHGVVAPAQGRWLHIAGQVGVGADGSVPPGFAEQAEIAWQNLVAVLAEARMDVNDLVKVTTFVTDASQLPQFAAARARVLGPARPASTLLVVAALARPEWWLEIEAVACRAS
jgi:2-iminobutanoate/2-iminopropanoate deaminase